MASRSGLPISVFKDPKIIRQLTNLKNNNNQSYLLVEFGSYSLWDTKNSYPYPRPEITKF